MPKVYLAGPEVFLPNATEVGAAKKRLCAAYGLTGLFPLDAEQPAAAPIEMGTAIYRANVRLMESADAVIANLTPFRGNAMDVGTAFEVGFCSARGKALFGYANTTGTLSDRTPHTVKDSLRVDERGWIVEDFGFFENLMIEVPIRSFGEVFTGAVPPGEILTSLTVFERAVRHAADVLSGV